MKVAVTISQRDERADGTDMTRPRLREFLEQALQSDVSDIQQGTTLCVAGEIVNFVSGMTRVVPLNDVATHRDAATADFHLKDPIT